MEQLNLNLVRASKRYDAKKIRLTLWNKSQNCCYCNELTFLPEDCPEHRKGTPPDNMATLEHVYTKFDEERYENGNRFLFALACYKCNNLMGSIRQAFVPIEELRRRSQLHAEKKERKRLWELKQNKTAIV